MSRCRHPRTSVSEVTRCYTGPVGERENQRAHGNVCHHETCARCGSERRTNSNQGARESSGWYRPEAG